MVESLSARLAQIVLPEAGGGAVRLGSLWEKNPAPQKPSQLALSATSLANNANAGVPAAVSPGPNSRPRGSGCCLGGPGGSVQVGCCNGPAAGDGRSAASLTDEDAFPG